MGSIAGNLLTPERVVLGMKRNGRRFLVLLFLSSGMAWSGASGKTEEGVFVDGKRDREVPYLAYLPEELDGRHPVLVFSHGLGGSKKGGTYLGEYLSERGYVCFHIQHIGSDASIWEGKRGERQIVGAMAASLKKPGNARNRFEDMPFVLDEIERLDGGEGALAGHLDLDKIGVMGHSYGARSVMVVSGERMSRLYLSMKDDRVKAGLALSPSMPHEKLNAKKALARVDIPIFHMTGTEDGSPLEPDMDPVSRTKPFGLIEGADQYLLVLEGADHMTFGGRKRLRPGEGARDESHWKAIQKGAGLFFDAYLKGDEEAKQLLRKGYKGELDKEDRFEWKEGEGK
ncbi:MAG: acetylhydrolase [Verrucomicrobiota bacterium]